MRDVLFVCPQERDFAAVRAAGVETRYRIRFVGRDLDALESFEPQALLDELLALPADGVVGTKDRSALLAALVAGRRGLPGPSTKALLACQHKPSSRELQRRAAPAATPRFAVLDGGPPDFPPPWFVKPVVGRLSQEARRVDEPAALASLAEEGGYREEYARIAELAGLEPASVHGFLVEELAGGLEVTLEGYVCGGRLTTIGITDSLKYPGTNSFERFEFPTALPDERQRELSGIAERLLTAHDFRDGFFNLEFLVPPDESSPARVIELNGRIASQFAPLVQAVHGRSTYEALLALACGDDPRWDPGPARGVAVSYCLRVFEDAEVRGVPEPQEGLEVLVRSGLRLSEQGTNDPHSYRLAIFHGWGETREEAVARCRERAASLRFELVR